MVCGSCFYFVVSVAFSDGFGSAFPFHLQGAADSTSSYISHDKEWEFLVITSFLAVSRQLSPPVVAQAIPFLRKSGVRRRGDLWGDPTSQDVPRALGRGKPQEQAMLCVLCCNYGTNAHFQQR